MIELKTTTYGCACGYTVDAETFENLEYFTAFSRNVGNVEYGTCPSCRVKKLARVIDLGRLSTHSTIQEDEIEALTEVERDSEGRKVLVDSGEVKQEIGIVDGQPAIIETPILVEKTRELTNEEKAEKLEEANRALDNLAAKEFNPNQVG